eukprot:scaffold22637_cov41-Phaeocystis_antarctica.AAC.3
MLHVCDAGSVPARYVCVELDQVPEEIGHVCDCRDTPARDGAVRRSGGRRVGVIGFDRRLQGALVREGVGWRRGRRRLWRRIRRVGRRRQRRRRQGRRRRRRRARAQAAPSRTVPSDKLGVARPCATGEDLVCVGQRVRALPSRSGSIGKRA